MTSISSRKVALFVLVFISLASSAVAAPLLYGSKVQAHPTNILGDIDEGRALSPFYIAPQFAFLDLNANGIPDPDEPIYIHIDPTVSRVSENDVRITLDYSSPYFSTGSQVRSTDSDHDKELRKFGEGRVPVAELRYFDVDGDKAYSIDDPVYLEFNHGFVTAGDVRITNYTTSHDFYEAGSRVRDSDADSDKPTLTLPGMLCFYNADGDINNAGWAIYGAGDSIYLDTQYPFYSVTPNDIRMTESSSPPPNFVSRG